MLSLAAPASGTLLFDAGLAREAVVSWNARAPQGRLELRVYDGAGHISGWLPYVAWDRRGRRSLSGSDEVATIELDVVRAPRGTAAIEVRASVALDAVAVSTPPRRVRATSAAAFARTLDVPARSQYLPDGHSGERGWCSPASLAMLLAYWGRDLPTAEVAARVRDDADGGTGNWTFNVALAGALGLRAAVVHLHDLAHAAAFIAAGIPLALSFSWRGGELPNAPLEHTDGHLGVLIGFAADGAALLNDPAQPALRVAYPRDAFERAWLGHGGIAYAIAPPERAPLAALSNA